MHPVFVATTFADISVMFRYGCMGTLLVSVNSDSNSSHSGNKLTHIHDILDGWPRSMLMPVVEIVACHGFWIQSLDYQACGFKRHATLIQVNGI